MSRRGEIAMTSAEVDAFLASERVVTVATLGRDGWPHLMPLWYVVRDGALWSWTYAKSQKVRNLERDRRCTLQVEAGRDVYAELRGVMIRAEAVLHRDADAVLDVGLEIGARYTGARYTGAPLPEEARAALPEEARTALRAQAPKRVAIEFRERSRATWDHRKLGGGR